ncbi:MAG TPA: RluA family pseudouridine synthase [Quisquiliibacterium sp.]|nr:RluA family pseudouridine synthase [Quisquiliibacterium sp.]
MNALSTKAPKPDASGDRPSARPAVRQLSVDEDAGAGQRLDNFLLRHCRGVPKSHLYRLIRSGQVRVNGGRCRPDDRLEPGDVVRVPPVSVAEAPLASAPAPAVEFPVLHEDAVLLAVDKPAGVAVHGGSGVAHGVIEQLRAARPQAVFLELAHRLDRETSGVLLLGKKRRALLDLHAQLRERRTDKRYLAIVVGRWPLRTKTVQFALHRYLTPEGERRVRVQDGGQAALTRVTGLRQFELPGLGVFTLVEAKIETGRTHQIRVHLAHSGFPIAGDDKYGSFELNRALQRAGHRRMYLHAHSISIRHPDDGRPLRLVAPVPEAFDRLVAAGRPVVRAPASTGGDEAPDAAPVGEAGGER